jgi:hypothetical protein
MKKTRILAEDNLEAWHEVATNLLNNDASHPVIRVFFEHTIEKMRKNPRLLFQVAFCMGVCSALRHIKSGDMVISDLTEN